MQGFISCVKSTEYQWVVLMGRLNEIPYWHWGKITMTAVSTVGESAQGGRSGARLGTSSVVQLRDSGYCFRMAGETERTSLH